jgi:hypothetical protein
LLQILCMAVYRNIFLASGCLSKIFFEVRWVCSQITMVELFYPLNEWINCIFIIKFLGAIAVIHYKWYNFPCI